MNKIVDIDWSIQFSSFFQKKRIILFIVVSVFFSTLGFTQTYLHPTGNIENTFTGGCMEITCSGTYFDDGGSGGNYSSGINNYQTFCPTQANRCLTVTFNTFQLGGGDALDVRMGPTQNSSSTSYGGTSLQGQTITSTDGSGCLTFAFESSSSGAGWSADFSCAACLGPMDGINFDCQTAQPVCDEVSALAGNSVGPGFVSEGCGGVSCVTSETYSNWYIFTILQGGSLGLEITPTPNSADYDFAFFGPVNPDDPCTIGSAIRCSYAANTGATGMRAGEADLSENVTGNAWVRDVNVVAGETYVLLLNQWQFVPSNFELIWTGSATIGSPEANVSLFETGEIIDEELKVCIGDEIELEAQFFSGSTYIWTLPDGSTETTVFPLLDAFFVTQADLGEYTLSYSVNNGCPGAEKIFNLVNDNLVEPVPNPVDPICGSGIPNLSVQSCGPGSTISWYDAEVGGNQIATGATPNPNFPSNNIPTINQTTSFYVSCQPFGSQCPGPRVEVEAVVTSGATPPVVTSPINYCIGDVSSALSALGMNLTWYPAENSNLGSTDAPIPSTLVAGSQSFWVSQTDGCEGSRSEIEVIVSSPPNITGTPVVSDATCGSDDGSVSVAAAGGIAPLSYSMDGGAFVIGNTFNGLSSGNHTVIVRDANMCEVSTGVINVGEANGPSIMINSSTDATCGNNNGSISASITDGAIPYSFSINGGSFVMEAVFLVQIQSLLSGNYVITVRDGNLCEVVSSSVSIGNSTSPDIDNTVPASTTCGGDNGTITITATGGTAPYRYSVDGVIFSVSNPITGLSAGDYQVTVRDANDCEVQSASMITVGAVSDPGISNTPTVSEKCGQGDGSITINATGGTAPYNYSLDGGAFQSNNSFTGLSSGDYVITIRDASMCEVVSNSINVGTVTASTITAVSPTQTACNNNTGTVTVVASGATPFEYSINNGAFQNSNIFNGLSASSYTVIIRDNNGCTTTAASVSVTEFSSPTISSTTPSETACDNNTGSIAVVASGNAPFEYSIDGLDFQNNSSLTSLGEGTYTVTIRDANGCTASSNTISITEVAGPTVSTITPTETACGGSTGTLDITAVGSAPLAYSLDGLSFQASSMFTGLAASSYSVIVRDNNGCTTTSATTSVTDANGPSVDVIGSTASTCNADNGTIKLTASGGNGLLEYSLDGTNFQSSDEFQDLSPGNYTITVRDENNCIATEVEAVMNESSPVIDLIALQAASCGDSNGTIEVTATGGTGSLEYSLDGISFQSSSMFSNLGASSYTVTIRDENNCEEVSSLQTINNASSPTIDDTDISPATCGVENGTIEVTASGGSDLLEYSLDGIVFQVSNRFQSLSSGNYTVTIRDGNNCMETTGLLNLADASSPSIVDVAPSPATCGDENGSIIITASGGMGDLKYSTDGITYQISSEFTGLSFGNYDVFVRDANQCVVSEFNIEVADASTPVIDNIENAGSTCGESNARIEVTTSGGTGLLSYSLDGTTFQNENEFIALSSGSYTLIIRDGNNCEISTSITISNEVGPTIDDTQLSEATCGDSNGTITVIATGGSGDLEYSLDGINFQSENEFTSLVAANYTITIRDENDCTAELSNVDLSSADTPVIDNTDITESTCGDENGSIRVTATGGVGVIAYSLDGLNFQSENEFTNLAAADYTITIKDGNDCSVSSSSMSLGDMEGPLLSQVDANQATCGQSNGSISVVGSGGSGLLEYSLDDINYQVSGDFSNLSPGVFTISIRDENDCVFSSNPISVADPDGPVVDQAIATAATCGIANGTVNATATGGVGTLEYSIDGINFQVTGDFINLSAASYTVRVRDGNDCAIDFAAVTVADASSPEIDLISTNQSSCGESNGSIELSVIGGTGLLEYSLDGGLNFQTSSTFENLGSAIYVVIIRDENQCEVSSTSIDLMDASSPILEDVSITASTCGADNGTINITASGGTGRLEYSLDDLSYQGINEFNNLESGSYTVFIKDQNDCTITSNTITISAQASPSITRVESTEPSCGSTDGIITIVATGGTGNISYSIDGGLNFQTTNNFTNLGSSNYELLIKDENDCQLSQSFPLNELGGPTIDNIIDAPPLCGDSDGSIRVIATGGTGLLTYSIDGGSSFQSTNEFTGLENADYDIVVRDGGGCSTNEGLELSGPARLNFSCSMTKEASDDIKEDGAAQFVITGGTAPYVVSWTGVNTGSLNIPITGESNLGSLKGGVYQIEIIDANGCNQSCELNISFPLCTRSLTASISGSESICQGEEATITFNFDGGASYDIRYVNDLNEVFNLEGITDGHTVVVSPSSTTVYSLVGALPVNIPCEVILSESVVSIAVSELELETKATSNYKGVNISCNGGTDGSALVAVKKGLSPFSYEWSNGTTSEELTEVSAGNYLVTVSDGASCSRVDSINLIGPAELQVNLSSRNPDCFEEDFGSILLEEISGGTSPYTISVGEEEYKGLKNFPQTLPLIPIGGFEVTIRDENGCEIKEAIELNRASERVISLGKSIRISEGEGVELRPEVNFTVSRVEWGIDSTLSCTDCMNPIASPSSSRKYMIVIFDDLGCFVSDAITVLVEKQREVLVPSGFSPNGDNTNDVLYVHAGSVVGEIELFQIYSRWGELVFSRENFPANDPIYGWDGRFTGKEEATTTIGDANGKQLNTGVFIYRIKAKFLDGLTKTFTGEITLIR